ncbi:unnamed protein product, partial [Phaeothamnion confervicola]
MENSVTLAVLARCQTSASGAYRVLRVVGQLRLRPSLALLNAVVRALGQHSDVAGVCRVFDRMAAAGLQPDTYSYNSVLYGLV